MTAAVVSGVALVESGTDLAAAAWTRKPPRLARMDRLCGLALLAAERALRDAGVSPGTPAWNPDRTAIVVATAFGCHATNEDYFRGVLAQGIAAASPRLFAYTLPSSPLGEVSIHVDARGPAQTLVSGRHAALEAVESARSLCATGRVDRVLVIAVEVDSTLLRALGYDCQEGAAAIVIEPTPPADRVSRAIVWAGASAFRADDPEAAVEAARRRLSGSSGLPPALTALSNDSADTAIAVPGVDGAVAPLAALVSRIIAHAPTGPSPGVLAIGDRSGGAAALLIAPSL